MAGGRWPVVGGRFIPACAGNAQPCRTPWKQSPVHPRVCGERRPRHHAHAQDAGSSPRVRGTPRGLPLPIDYGRFIPACAGNALRSPPSSSPPPVHPRVCGERIKNRRSRSSTSGSSPRVRGTPDRAPRRVAPERFIPACAGNAATSPARWPTSPVHPRVCGERGNGSLLLVPHAGSSPRVRGTRRDGHGAGHRRRFIPACAGNAACGVVVGSEASVHPRVCGERGNGSLLLVPHAGSSPRVRGTRRDGHGAGHRRRFIPACAGNAACGVVVGSEASVHPRVCGERVFQGDGLAPERGSSPRVRGTRRPVCHPLRCVRFIPACAGNARSWPIRPSGRSVHPRVCGERVMRYGPGGTDRGSSPRVRGTRGGAALRRRRVRFIPACAGNACGAAFRSVVPPVHPRVCGERVFAGVLCRTAAGSSPRVRGTLMAALGLRRVRRFIPACAGNAEARGGCRSAFPVHPRVCGERGRAPRPPRHMGGSSPRVRGTRAGSR